MSSKRSLTESEILFARKHVAVVKLCAGSLEDSISNLNNVLDLVNAAVARLESILDSVTDTSDTKGSP
jgi:hypothetical protein